GLNPGFSSTENTFQNAIITMRNRDGIACNRVDFIAHGTAGCVAREIITSLEDEYFAKGGAEYRNYDKGFINKLITVGTPHNGSHVADYIVTPFEIAFKIVGVINHLNTAASLASGIGLELSDVLGVIQIDAIVFRGMRDLRALSGGASFELTEVKHHLIASDVDEFNNKEDIDLLNEIDVGWLKVLYQAVRTVWTSFDWGVHEIFNELYGSDEYLSGTNWLVPVTSQLAGSSASEAIDIEKQSGIASKSIVYGSDRHHFDIIQDITVGTKIFNLLNSPIESDYFADVIPANNNAQNNNVGSTISTSLRSSSVCDTTFNYIDTLSIKIDAPATGATVYVDSAVQVKIQVKDTNGLEQILVLYQSQLLTSFSKDSLQTFLTLTNSKYIGDGQVVVVAVYDSMGCTVNHIDSVSINVTTLDTIVGFYVSPAQKFLTSQQIFQPEYKLIYENFIGYLKEDNDSLFHSIADTNVIVYDSTNYYFVAKDTGSTHIVFTHKGLSDTSYIIINTPIQTAAMIVCPGDSLVLSSGSYDSTKVYQWQVDTLDGFNDISDNQSYSGTDSSILTITNTPSHWFGHSYLCVISDSVGATTSRIFALKFKMLWTGAVDSLWSTPGNWSCDTIPDSHTDVLIPSDVPRFPQVHSYAYCRTLELEDSSSIDVKSPNLLCVGGGYTGFNCPGTMVVEISGGGCETTVEYNVISDATCSGTFIKTLGIESGGVFPVGTTTNCFELTDESGVLVGSCCFDVIVVAIGGCGVLICPNDFIINLAPGACDTVVIYSVDIDSTIGGEIIQTSGVESGGDFPIGITTNCFELYDDLDVLIGTCCFDVEVVQTGSFELICPPSQTIYLDPGECDVQVNYGDIGFGYCNGSLIQTSGIASGGIFPVDTTTNCFLLVDTAGVAIDSCCFDVIVVEFENPTTTLACNDNVQVSVNEDCEAFISPDMILEGGPYACYDNYLVAVEGFGSDFGGVLIGKQPSNYTSTSSTKL
ncbi:MAG: hypothetical protein DRI69_11790, partial [Bacteroidetes bacterium]